MIPGVVASATSGGGGGPTYVATELFSDADTTNLNGKTTTTGAKTWTVGGGGFDCFSGKGRPTSISGSAYATIAAGVADIDLSCDITIANDIDGLIFRLVDGANYWRIGLDDTGNAIHLMKAIAGAETEPGTATGVTMSAASTYNLRVVTSGSAITVYFDGVSKISISDGQHSTATKHGIIAGSTSTRFDNVLIA